MSWVVFDGSMDEPVVPVVAKYVTKNTMPCYARRKLASRRNERTTQEEKCL